MSDNEFENALRDFYQLAADPTKVVPVSALKELLTEMMRFMVQQSKRAAELEAQNAALRAFARRVLGLTEAHLSRDLRLKLQAQLRELEGDDDAS